MTDSSSTFNKASSSSHQPIQPSAILAADYTCPVCNQAIIQIAGNCLTYLQNHVYNPPDEPHTLIFFHPPQIGTDFVPAKQIKPPFLIVDSINIVTPHSVPQNDK